MIADELGSLTLTDDTDRYYLEVRDGVRVAVEKRRDMIDPGARLFVGRMGGDIPADIGNAMAAVGDDRFVRGGALVAVKVNLGGGVAGVPSSFTDPLVVEGVIDRVRELGGRPFVCEANMRSMTMHHSMLARRAIYPLLVRKDVEFVNLSDLPDLDFYPLGWEHPLKLSVALLHPEVTVISVPALKHHWECGVTLAGKNMYGAIAERQKSLFHRGGAIDETVAAAVRAVEPDISLLAHRQVGGKLGPHFCVPVNFGYIIASDSVMVADRVGCDCMGTDWREVKHLVANSDGREVPYRLVDGSVRVDDLTRRRVARTRISRAGVRFWRTLLYPQYYVPHRTQYRQIPKLEPLGTWINWLLFHPFGDPWPSRWRG